MPLIVSCKSDGKQDSNHLSFVQTLFFSSLTSIDSCDFLLIGSFDNSTTDSDPEAGAALLESEIRATSDCALILDVSQNEFTSLLNSKRDE